jgi:hypothetical protein
MPPQLNFAAQPVTTESASQLLTVFNVGNTPTAIPKSGLFFSGTNQKDFKIILPDTFPISLPSQSTLTVKVAFAPTADGGETRTATLNVPYVGAVPPASSPLQIPVSGTAVQQRS